MNRSGVVLILESVSVTVPNRWAAGFGPVF